MAETLSKEAMEQVFQEIERRRLHLGEPADRPGFIGHNTVEHPSTPPFLMRAKPEFGKLRVRLPPPDQEDFALHLSAQPQTASLQERTVDYANKRSWKRTEFWAAVVAAVSPYAVGGIADLIESPHVQMIAVEIGGWAFAPLLAYVGVKLFKDALVGSAAAEHVGPEVIDRLDQLEHRLAERIAERRAERREEAPQPQPQPERVYAG